MPSSQPSPASRTPLPQTSAALQMPGAPLALLQIALAQLLLPTVPATSALHALPVSILQAASQASPTSRFASSQPSPASSTPLPQVRCGSHTPGAVLPARSQMPDAHEPLPVKPGAVALHALPSSMLHVALQVSPMAVLPSSHPSPESSIPLPQAPAGSQVPGAPPLMSHTPDSQLVAPLVAQARPSSIKQVAPQPSPGVALPSSQPSPASRTLLPHVLAGSQMPGGLLLVMSHTPLAHDAAPVVPGANAPHGRPFSMVQAALQPSPEVVSPSSQPSPASTRPLPQVAVVSQRPGWPALWSHTVDAQDASAISPGASSLQL